MSAKEQQQDAWTESLKDPEVQESLTYLIRKLPDLQQSVESIEQMATFGQSFLQDRQTIDSFESRLQTYPIDKEAIEAGIELIGKLPLLLQHVELIEKATLFIQDVLGDERSIDQINDSVQTLPFVQKGKEALDLAKEIQARAEIEPKENISIFTLMKWLKDPTVQKGLHVTKQALTVLGERQK